MTETLATESFKNDHFSRSFLKGVYCVCVVQKQMVIIFSILKRQGFRSFSALYIPCSLFVAQHRRSSLVKQKCFGNKLKISYNIEEIQYIALLCSHIRVAT